MALQRSLALRLDQRAESRRGFISPKPLPWPGSRRPARPRLCPGGRAARERGRAQRRSSAGSRRLAADGRAPRGALLTVWRWASHPPRARHCHQAGRLALAHCGRCPSGPRVGTPAPWRSREGADAPETGGSTGLAASGADPRAHTLPAPPGTSAQYSPCLRESASTRPGRQATPCGRAALGTLGGSLAEAWAETG